MHPSLLNSVAESGAQAFAQRARRKTAVWRLAQSLAELPAEGPVHPVGKGHSQRAQWQGVDANFLCHPQ